MKTDDDGRFPLEAAPASRRRQEAKEASVPSSPSSSSLCKFNLFARLHFNLTRLRTVYDRRRTRPYFALSKRDA
ncbi:hypothetical protein GWI33_022579 [Rhynchophorus ferrugineus]|uniref:Uncharacterized protein n=1 Tax=Rhynchophorus ferrugineus TaxID=354439 RepID=A0A834IPP0_RHYFE|nr:hypothetical protein GWI33_022579 [Rhynchophorus ferrugineus]